MTISARRRGPGRALRVVDLVHRWTGGLIGMLLAVLGLSGTLLLHETAFVRATVAHAADPVVADDARFAAIAATFLGDPGSGVRSIRFAGDGLGVHRLMYQGGRGAYVDQAGTIVTRWTSGWQRPEVWLFDLHHLLMGETGTMLGGVAALAGIGFVVTGLLLWWRTRSTFSPRPLPKRASRPAILRHHRDLGVVAAPLLLLSFVTGAMMALKPVEALLLAPLPGGGAMPVDRARSRPTPAAGDTLDPAAVDWRAILAQAHRRFPDAMLRSIALPSKRDARLQVRLRQAGEWTPNGRTTLFFDAHGRVVEVRDAVRAPLRLRAKAAEYPLHTGAALPGLGRWVLTLSGLALTMLGSFAVATFWFGTKRMPARRVVAAVEARRDRVSEPVG